MKTNHSPLKSAIQVSRKRYLPLIKSLQTGLLLITGLAGFMSAKCPVLNWQILLGLFISLFLSISGSTVLNMWHDRDIDTKMTRTCTRPLPAGVITHRQALAFGIVLSFTGVGLSLLIDVLYGIIIFAGLFFDVFVYTIWLKRRTALSIIWGGIAGGMPILAGRTLGVESIDWIGIMLALAVLFWIPTHILTFSMRYYDDYQAAGIPTIPSLYGFQFTRLAIAISSVLAALIMAVAIYGVGLSWGFMRLLGVLSAVLLILAAISLVKPSDRMNFNLFKYASFYMLSTMVMLIILSI